MNKKSKLMFIKNKASDVFRFGHKEDYEIPIVYLNEDEEWLQPELEGLEEKHPPEAFRDKANGE